MHANVIEKTSDSELIPRFERLFIHHYCPDYWADTIPLPFGTYLKLDSRDMPPMVWEADLENNKFWDVVQATEELSDKHDVAPGFALSETWTGNVDAFKTYLQENGYTQTENFVWLIKDIKDYQPQPLETDYHFEETDDMAAFADIFGVCFSDDQKDVFLNGHADSELEQNRKFYLVKNNGEDCIGCASTYYKGDLAYLNSLGVHPDYRGQNVAQDLGRLRLNDLTALGNIRWASTAVYCDNNTSLSVQNALGYVPYSTVEYWLKSE